MSEEQMNENIQPESTTQEASSQEVAQETPQQQVSQPQLDTQQVQQQAAQIAQQTLESQIANNPLLQQFSQFQEFSQQQQQPSNPFDQELGLQNLPGAAKYAYEQGQQTSSRVEALEAQVQQIAQEKAALEYQNTLSGLRNQWTGIYGVPEGTDSSKVDEVIDNAIWKSIESDPMLAAQANAALSEQGYLSTDFLNQVGQKMKNDVAENILDPTKRDSFLKNLVQQELVRKDLQNQSMISSNIETSDSGKKTDNFSATFIADE